MPPFLCTKLSLHPPSPCAPAPCWVPSHLSGGLLGSVLQCVTSVTSVCHCCHLLFWAPALSTVWFFFQCITRFLFFFNKTNFNWFGAFYFPTLLRWCVRHPQGHTCVWKWFNPSQTHLMQRCVKRPEKTSQNLVQGKKKLEQEGGWNKEWSKGCPKLFLQFFFLQTS